MKVLVHTAHVEKRQCEVFDAHFIKDGLHTGWGGHTLSMPAISGLFWPFPSFTQNNVGSINKCNFFGRVW